jgi:hypothetical protein
VEEGDFVLLYGEDPTEEIYRKAAGVICVHTHQDMPYADALLPKPTVQEIEGTAIGDGHRTLIFHNPRKSQYFASLIKIFQEAGLLDKEHTLEYFSSNISSDVEPEQVMPLKEMLDSDQYEFATQPCQPGIHEKRLDILKAVKK